MKFIRVATESIDPLQLKALVQIVRSDDGIVENLTTPFTIDASDVLRLIGDLREIAAMLEAVKLTQGMSFNANTAMEKEIASRAKSIAKEARRRILVPEEETKTVEKEKPL